MIYDFFLKFHPCIFLSFPLIFILPHLAHLLFLMSSTLTLVIFLSINSSIYLILVLLEQLIILFLNILQSNLVNLIYLLIKMMILTMLFFILVQSNILRPFLIPTMRVSQYFITFINKVS